MKQPNVVYLLADQLRARSLPAYGERQITTPNIDRIAREGITFSNAVATCPLCAPYRSMLVTGRQPLETGHVINNVRARHDEISIADAFNHAGYRTGWVGKWHLFSREHREIVDFEYIPEGRDRLGFPFVAALQGGLHQCRRGNVLQLRQVPGQRSGHGQAAGAEYLQHGRTLRFRPARGVARRQPGNCNDSGSSTGAVRGSALTL